MQPFAVGSGGGLQLALLDFGTCPEEKNKKYRRQIGTGVGSFFSRKNFEFAQLSSLNFIQ